MAKIIKILKIINIKILINQYIWKYKLKFSVKFKLTKDRFLKNNIKK